MKAFLLYDGDNKFLGVSVRIRDITATFGDVPIRAELANIPPADVKQTTITGKDTKRKRLLGKILDKASASYREGVRLCLCLYMIDKNINAALMALDRALEVDSKLPYVWNDRGICYREREDFSSALKSHLKAVELAPDNPEIQFNLGDTRERIGLRYKSAKCLEAAIQTLKIVVSQIPNNADAWDHIGTCLLETGQQDNAKFHFERAREIRRTNKGVPTIHKCDEYL